MTLIKWFTTLYLFDFLYQFNIYLPNFLVAIFHKFITRDATKIIVCFQKTNLENWRKKLKGKNLALSFFCNRKGKKKLVLGADQRDYGISVDYSILSDNRKPEIPTIMIVYLNMGVFVSVRIDFSPMQQHSKRRSRTFYASVDTYIMPINYGIFFNRKLWDFFRVNFVK